MHQFTRNDVCALRLERDYRDKNFVKKALGSSPGEGGIYGFEKGRQNSLKREITATGVTTPTTSSKIKCVRFFYTHRKCI